MTDKNKKIKKFDSKDRGQFRGLMAGDGCDFSQVPKRPKEKMALCSDNTELSGSQYVSVYIFSAPVRIGNAGLHYSFR